MELNRVIIIYKKTLHKLAINYTASARAGRAPITSSMRYSAALNQLAATLVRMGIRVRFIDRTKLTPAHTADLIVSFGGDGTVLAAAHAAGATPILGVNFMPATSVGFFCAATPQTFKATIASIARDRLKPTLLPLLVVSIDGRRIKTMALNDVLFASPSPAEMSRYTLRIGTRWEAQRSSGVWIAAGPGSTAAMRSAGGNRQKIDSPRLQYLVREPCPLPKESYRLLRGALRAGQAVSIVSEMSNAFAYLDGPDLTYPLKRGSKLTVQAAPKALRIFL